jgi:lipoyl(octanoyl) transferase
MQAFTAGRDEHTTDELWLLEHPPVYTVGVAGRGAHLPRVANAIPTVNIDRGGQIPITGQARL